MSEDTTRIWLLEKTFLTASDSEFASVTGSLFAFQSLPTVNGFLDAAIAALPGWRKILPNYPVVSWLSFVEYIRTMVNSLASDGHIRELVCQLQLVGEVTTSHIL